MKQFLFLIAILAIAIKTMAIFLGGPIPLHRDSLGYWELSTLVLQGDFLMLDAPIAYRTPGYPWFLAILRLFGENHSMWLIAVVQSVLYVGSVWVASNIAQKITKLPSSRTITAICLLPAISAIQYTNAVLSETIFTLTLLVHLSSVLSYSQKPSNGNAIWSATTLAILILIKPIAVLLWIAHVILLLYYLIRRSRSPVFQAFRFYQKSHLTFSLLIVICLVGPWVMRNHLLFGRPSLTEFVGRNLWIVTFQDGSGSSLPFSPTPATVVVQQRMQAPSLGSISRSTWVVSNQLVRSGLNDAQTDQLMKQVAIDSISKNRLDFLKKMIRRCVNFWRCPHTDPLKQGGYPREFSPQYSWNIPLSAIEWLLSHRFSQSVFGNTLLTGCVLLSLLILLRNPPSRPSALWLSLIFAYFSIITGVFEIPDYRYRLIIEPLAATSIGSAISTVLSKRELIASTAD